MAETPYETVSLDGLPQTPIVIDVTFSIPIGVYEALLEDAKRWNWSPREHIAYILHAFLIGQGD